MKKTFKRVLSLVLTLSMVLSLISVGAYAKEGGSTTDGQPFPATSAGHYRIPSIITTKEGTLLAAADMRWGAYNQSADDTANIDTIVSRSVDEGDNWTYSYANYIADNGDRYDANASVLIDPAMVQADNGTIYMIVDLFLGQAGSGYNSIAGCNDASATGFDAEGNLLLRENALTSSADYYLKDGAIYNADGTQVAGYTVDAYFNLSQNGSVVGNLFTYSTAYFQPVYTSYLYLTTSVDDGQTWSAPTLLNLKNSSETYYIVSPGRGTVTADGVVVFPCYASNNQASFIYSNDNGATWQRSAATGVTSTEAEIVELADGTLRMFYRHGDSNMNLCYIDAQRNSDGTYTWGSAVSTGVACHNNTNLSAISYGETATGEQIILVSVPGDTSGAWSRNNGRIFTFTVGADKTMTLQNTYEVNNSAFSYSSMTLLANGDVALLYEKGDSGNITYVEIAAAEVLGNLELPEDHNIYSDEELGIEVDFGQYDVTEDANATAVSEVAGLTGDFQAYEVVPGEGYEKTAAKVTITLNDTLKAYPAAQLKGFFVENGNVVTVDGTKNADTYTFEVPHFSTVGVLAVENEENNDENVVQVELVYGETSTRNVEGANYAGTYTATPDGIVGVTVTGSDETDGVKYTKTSAYVGSLGVTSNSYTQTSYYCQVDGAYYPLYARRVSGTYYGSDTYRYYYSYLNASNTLESLGDDYIYASSNSSYPVNAVQLYTQTAGDPVPASTTIQFTGEAVGTATVTIGDTTYQITVTPEQKTVTLYVGTNLTLDNTGTVTTAPDGAVATATVSGGILTITGVAAGTTTALVGNVQYNITVEELPAYLGSYTIQVGGEQAVEISLSDGQTVKWTTDDTSVAYAYKDILNEGKAVILGRAVGNTEVHAQVYNADGTLSVTYNWQVTVTRATTSTQSRTAHVIVDKIEHSTVYYSLNGGDLVEVTEGVVFNSETIRSNGLALVFFAAPDEGYALTFMAATNTEGEYHCISNGNADGTGSDFYTGKNLSATSGRPSDVLTDAQIKAMLTQAIELGCDGGLWWTRKSGDTANINTSHLTFVSQKLPTLEKKIVSITRNGVTTAYTDETTVDLGETINYQITVTRYATNATYGTITYSNEKLVDELTHNQGITTPTLGTSTTYDRTYTYNTSLELTLDNFDEVVKDGVITNTVDFAYSYSSQYSKGTLNENGNAVAEISVEVQEYVVDFGLPVEIDLSSVAGDAVPSGGTATYGTVSVNGSKIIYAPTSVLQKADYVTVNFTNGQTYAIRIYPATTVYYEEGLADFSGSWSEKVSSDYSAATQQTQIAGDAKGNYYNFGYDANGGYYSGAANTATSAKTITRRDSLTFTFTGTGVDLFANCVTDSGIISVRVYDGDKTLEKLVVMDLANVGDYRSGGNAVNTPVVSIEGLTYGAHEVVVTLASARTSGFVFDGFRVYNTVEKGDNDIQKNIYNAVDEDNPDYIELRSLVLAALDVDVSSASEQVYSLLEASDATAKAVVTYNKETAEQDDSDVKSGVQNGTTAEDLLNVGPKNELYLWPGMSVTFKVNTARALQIGMRSVDGSAATYTVNGGDEKTISSSVDMFYNLQGKLDKATETTFVISNTSGGILSLTDLKVCDAPENAEDVLDELAAEDVIDALNGKFDPIPEPAPKPPVEKPEIPENEDFVDVPADQWYTSAVGWAKRGGITAGYEDGTFRPALDCNRAAFVTFLWNAAGQPAAQSDANPFADVNRSDWYYDAVLWAYEKGITSGTSATTFSPDKSCSRAEAVTFLWNQAGKPAAENAANPFADVSENNWYHNSVLWAHEKGITKGTGENAFSPELTCNRATLVTFLWNQGGQVG